MRMVAVVSDSAKPITRPAMPVALVLNQRFFGRGLAKVIIFLPWAVSLTMTAIVWRRALNGQTGLLNASLQSLGLLDQPIAWLATPEGAMGGIVVAKTWLSVPLFSAFFIAGLQSLPQEQVEAAPVQLVSVGIVRGLVGLAAGIRAAGILPACRSF